MLAENTPSVPTLRTSLFDTHLAFGAKMVPFAGYDMPLHYKEGILSEHKWVRSQAGLFDVSHMGVVDIPGPQQAQALETLIPADLSSLLIGQVKYCFLLNAQGGIEDDLLITRTPQGFTLVVNASRKAHDLAYLSQHGIQAKLRDTCILALQGPQARTCLGRLIPEVSTLPFMQSITLDYKGEPLTISSTGYTGEDGFEIIGAPMLVEDLNSFSEVAWIGLGARDSLRLEAGLSLYGQELTDTITPIEAGLKWALGRQRHFVGMATIEEQITKGPSRQRVGLTFEPGAIPRHDTLLFNSQGQEVGIITSGGFSPMLERPIALALVAAHARQEALWADIRGQKRLAQLSSIPFVPHRYFRGLR